MVHKSNPAHKHASHVASLMGFVLLCGSSFFLILNPIGTFYLKPRFISLGDGDYLGVALRMSALTAGPVICTYLERRRGKRGIKGGALGGGLSYGVFVAFMDLFFPQNDPFSLGTALKKRDKILERLRMIKGRFPKARIFVTITVAKGNRPPLSWKWDLAKYRAALRADGAYLLRSNQGGWTAEEFWETYIQLTVVERAFRVLKTELLLRPVWHHYSGRTQAHVMV
jgi:hypothetical protein